MLTDDEIQAVLIGAAEISNGKLFNINAKLTFRTGTKVRLYQGRKWELMLDDLLNDD